MGVVKSFGITQTRTRIRIMAKPVEPNSIAVPKRDLEVLRAKTANTMLNITARTVSALDVLSERLDGIDNALALKCNLDDMSIADLNAYFFQVKESFRLRQDFLRALSGYDVDTSRVPVQEESTSSVPTYSEEVVDEVKQEIMRRSSSPSST